MGIIDNDSARKLYGQALTLLLARQWLEKNGYDIQPMELDTARAVVDSYSCDQNIFYDLLRMCLEYGNKKDLEKGEPLAQGIAQRFNAVASATYQAKPPTHLVIRHSEILHSEGDTDTAIKNLLTHACGTVNSDKFYLHLYVANFELMKHKTSVALISDEEAKRLVRIALATGNEEQLESNLQTIRSVSEGIPNQPGPLLINERKDQLKCMWDDLLSLQNYSKTGSLSTNNFVLTLKGGLQEAQRQGFYEGEIPDTDSLKSHYGTLDQTGTNYKQLYAFAERTNNPLALSAIYNSSLGFINDDSAHIRNGHALTVLLARQWLVKNGYNIKPIELNTAQAAVDSYSQNRYIFNEIQRLCLGDDKHANLGKGESIAQGIAQRFNAVLPAHCLANPRPSLDSVRMDSPAAVRAAPHPSNELIHRMQIEMQVYHEDKIVITHSSMSTE